MTENTGTSTTEATAIDQAAVDTAARKFAQHWDTSASTVYNAAVHARSLKESGLKGVEIVDTLRVAIAERQAGTLGITSPADVAAMASSVKISASTVSQLGKALTRTETAAIKPADNKAVVKAFYDAAVSKVKAADLDDIAKSAAELTGPTKGIVEFVLANIAEQRTLAGSAAKRSADEAKRAKQTDPADAVEAAVSVTKNGAAAFTAAEILRAAHALATNTGDADFNKYATAIVEFLAS